jgi:hypothetical protein
MLVQETNFYRGVKTIYGANFVFGTNRRDIIAIKEERIIQLFHHEFMLQQLEPKQALTLGKLLGQALKRFQQADPLTRRFKISDLGKENDQQLKKLSRELGWVIYKSPSVGEERLVTLPANKILEIAHPIRMKDIELNKAQFPGLYENFVKLTLPGKVIEACLWFQQKEEFAEQTIKDLIEALICAHIDFKPSIPQIISKAGIEFAIKSTLRSFLPKLLEKRGRFLAIRPQSMDIINKFPGGKEAYTSLLSDDSINEIGTVAK